MALDDESISKTAFITAKGRYEQLRVTSGLIQSPARFQELMKEVLEKVPLARPVLTILSHLLMVWKINI